MKIDVLPVINVEIAEDGKVVKRLPQLDRDGQLTNALLHRLYPEIKVARVKVPTFSLDEVETEQVKDSISSFTVDGIEYRLIGAGSSAKDGTFYAVDAAHEKQIAKRFENWPQAAITYFGILVSDCRTMIARDYIHGEGEAMHKPRVLVVKDLELGTNDCRGWISERLFAELELPNDRFYQFRLAIGSIQAKGCFKVMTNAVAEAAGADIIIPLSSTKPKVDLSKTDSVKWCIRLWHPSIHAKLFEGPLVLGIRDFSKPEQYYNSSYTVIAHATEESLEKEIIPAARENVWKVVHSALEGDYSGLLESIGASASQQTPIDNEQTEFTSFETSLPEALLKADSSGWSLTMPYVQGRLQKLLARWAFKACTAGLFKFPAFALMDDGVLFLQNGRLGWAADWIPYDSAVCGLESDRGLEVRFPVRKKADLLPYTRLSRSQAIEQLVKHFAEQKITLDFATVADIVDKQLCIEGTFVMHSKKAAENGGDFDYDCICVIPSKNFPLFVRSREQMTVTTTTKNKKPRPKAPWWNLAEVAMSAKGNVIGWITDMTTAALAASRFDLAEELSVQLQNALDSLKHDVTVDFKRLREIQKEIPTLPWMATKRMERVDKMPEKVEIAGSNDIVGKLYNAVRTDIQNLFQNVSPLHEFKGLMRGVSFTQEMYEECRLKNEEFRVLCKQNRERQEELDKKLALEQEAFDADVNPLKQKAKLSDEDRKLRKNAERRLARAKKAIEDAQEQSKTELRNFYLMIRIWAEGKTENRDGWAKALWTIVTDTKHEKATGALFYQAFPQELIDAIIKRTGGQPVRLQLPDVPDGEIRYDEDGNVFLVQPYTASDGSRQQKLVFLFRIEKGRIWMDGTSVQTVQGFAMHAGAGAIHNGEVVLTDIQARPTLQKGKVLHTPKDRIDFMNKCVATYGNRKPFVVYVEHDPQSRQVIQSVTDMRKFLDSASERPWCSAAYEPVKA